MQTQMFEMMLESAVRASLIAIFTGALLFILRVKAARMRHIVWTGVVILMLALPGWTAWGPKARVRVLDPAPVAAMTTPVVAATSLPDSLPDSPPPTESPVTWRTFLAAAYLIGVGALLARLAIGTVRASRLTSDSCAAPVTVGLLNPTVILPEGWERWPQAQLDAVLAHEGEHARRRDPLVQWLALFNRAIFWFHPLAWWLERRLSTLAEEACDAAVLAKGHSPFDYSEYLLRLARIVEQAGARVNTLGMAMPGALLPNRIRRILAGQPQQRISRVRMASVAVTCAVVAIAFTAVDFVRAQTPRPVVTPAVVTPAAVTPAVVTPAVVTPAVVTPVVVEPVTLPTPPTIRKRPPMLLAQAQSSPAKSDRGSVIGTVEDPSGAMVPRCVITARNQSGTHVEVAVSDPAGAYTLPSIQPGRYKLEFATPGFSLRVMEAEVVAGKQVRVDARLDVGSTNEHVTITAAKLASGEPATPPVRTTVRVRIGGSVQAMHLIKKVSPAYPPELRQQGIEGTVLIRAVISKEGVPLHPHVLNANEIDPRLAAAAMDSVQQWRYQPTKLNGEPVETMTTVMVEFQLEK